MEVAGATGVRGRSDQMKEAGADWCHGKVRPEQIVKAGTTRQEASTIERKGRHDQALNISRLNGRLEVD